MANKHDLQYMFASSVASNAATNIGGAIAAGKTRFLTYIRVTKTDDATYAYASTAGGHVVVAPHSAVASGQVTDFWASRTLGIVLPNISACSDAGYPAEALQQAIPRTPNMDHPILSVAGGASSYMLVGNGERSTVALASVCMVDIFAIYYDE